MSNENQNEYEVGYKKPPVSTRFKKGGSGNPSGKRKEVAEDLNPGKVLQTIDNEEIMVTIDGKRKRMRKGEIHFRQLFTKAIKADLIAARLIAKEAARYFGPEADGPSELRWVVESDDELTGTRKVEMGPQDKAQARRSDSENRGTGRSQLERSRPQVSIGAQFRKVAKESITIEIDGTPHKISRWDAYARRIYNMALNKNNSAARLLDQLRSQFPGDLLPGDPITFLIREEDTRL
jgi:hypothetical protein